jgi:two-component system response regulator ResD
MQIARRICIETNPDLIILDIMLPELDGFAITQIVREDFSLGTKIRNTPIIILTSRVEEIDRVFGFELGVDDYVVKPFSPRELVGRVKAVLRRATTGGIADEKPIYFGKLCLDPQSRMLLLDQKPVPVTAKDFDLLWFLANHPRQVFTRSQLQHAVWGEEFESSEGAVTAHIHRLREKIEVDADNPKFLCTVWGAGYKFDPSGQEN